MAKALRIQTPRLRLRPLAGDDLDAVHRLWTDPEVRRFLWDGEIIPRDRAALEIEASTASFEAEGFGLWALLPAERSSLIGFCGLRRTGDPSEIELLYGLHPDQWGRGLATEAARAVLRYGFEDLGLPRTIAAADAPNTASVAVMRRLGMRFERRGLVRGLDTITYALACRDFQGNSEGPA